MEKNTIAYHSKEEINRFQVQLLKLQLQYLANHSPYYKKLFSVHGIDVKSIQTIEDLTTLPLTSKNDLQLHNDDFFCVPQHEIVDYCTTSGTLGSPVTFGLTESDLDRLAKNEMQSFQIAGIQKGDVVQLMTTIDRRFMAGLAYFLGLRKLGVGIIRVGSGIPQMQWDSILKYNPNYLVSVPSFLLKLIEFAEHHGIDYKKSSVKGVICIGEALRDKDLNNSVLTQRILEKWDIKLYSTYASTEMGAAFTECEHFQGGHVQPELIITEILDDEERSVADGESGELVITTLGVQGVPLLRFKTGDIVRKYTTSCACGRNTYRIGAVEGRKQHMVKYKGTTLYPPAMHDLLAGFPQISLHQIEISRNEIGTDEIVIRISCSNISEEFLNEVKDHFRAKLRVAPKIEFVALEELQRSVFNPISRKPIIFVDNREA
ncbi:phenylacetate--CoA ligase [Sphingobacterium alkalisoli]|uniref:Phenylacetate--CoA ligase n=1 Tax=Sphingobacterium alkalisoli TaxID=1874115 RepID=A0A4U0H8W9_9SPHI|nr:AMP-binding protein [Sphingobacterium alkalisoli]TJY68271.1 phenylacetate--CoA ligase [Sphingobacterium alkalisoli]GGH07689.1 phenylacetate--CoA ligase [Sphingobacterium alkalisoli]